MAYVQAGVAAKELGLTTEGLREWARTGALPDGAVIATPGGRFKYDIDRVREWMLKNFKRLTRVARMEAQA